MPFRRVNHPDEISNLDVFICHIFMTSGFQLYFIWISGSKNLHPGTGMWSECLDIRTPDDIPIIHPHIEYYSLEYLISNHNSSHSTKVPWLLYHSVIHTCISLIVCPHKFHLKQNCLILVSELWQILMKCTQQSIHFVLALFFARYNFYHDKNLNCLR